MKTRSRSGPYVVKMILLVCLLALGWPTVAHAEDPPPPSCPTIIPEGCVCDILSSEFGDQIVLTCMPEPPASFNGILVLYAHGYVDPQELLALPLEEIGDFFPVIDTMRENGFAFATSSYSKNGYAIEQAGNDLNALVNHFKTLVHPSSVRKVFITGASEGGIIATMLVEKYPLIYAGGLALCGPVGGMPFQIQHLGDFRVVFDYFFDDIMQSEGIEGIYDEDPVDLGTWEDIKEAIRTAFTDHPETARQLFKVTGVAADPEKPAESAIDVLKFSVLGINDMVATSGRGHPYGNRLKWYRGSENDFALNIGVERVDSDFSGRKYIRDFYNTTGKLERPLVTLHTTGDDAVPFKHELIYSLKVALQGRSHKLVSIPVFRDGHCEFEVEKVLGAFVLLLLMTL